MNSRALLLALALLCMPAFAIASSDSAQEATQERLESKPREDLRVPKADETKAIPADTTWIISVDSAGDTTMQMKIERSHSRHAIASAIDNWTYWYVLINVIAVAAVMAFAF
jgi:hypothetical protein